MAHHLQLLEVATELHEATLHAERLAGHSSDTAWVQRPGPGRWSAAECIAHLNMTSEAYVALLQRAIAQGRSEGLKATSNKRFRLGLVGWLLNRSLEPPVRRRFKTTKAFIAMNPEPKEELMEKFVSLQKELHTLIQQMHGLDLSRLRINSPFSDKVKYNAFAALKILVTHERRHIWQAEQALKGK